MENNHGHRRSTEIHRGRNNVGYPATVERLEFYEGRLNMGMAGKKKLAVDCGGCRAVGHGDPSPGEVAEPDGDRSKSEPPTIFSELESGPQVQPTFVGESTKLKRTVILPTLDTPMVAGKNNIWCSTFQLSWNEMKDTVIARFMWAEGPKNCRGDSTTQSKPRRI